MGTKKLGLAALLLATAFSTGALAAPDATTATAKKPAAAATAGGKVHAKKSGRKATVKTAKKVVAKPVLAPSPGKDILAAATTDVTPKADAPKSDPPKSDTTILAAKVSAPTAAAATASESSLLPVKCKSGVKDPRCGRPMWGSGGTLGSGPAIHGTSGFPSVGEGFVDGNRLVVAVEMGAQQDDQGVIMGVDLATGNRTILSGKIEDPATGPVVVGSGPDLGNVRAVAKAGASWMALVSTGTQSPISIIRIDPKTGSRTLEVKLDKGLVPACVGSTQKLFVDFTSGIAASPDGTSYVAVGNAFNAVGIVAFKGGSCKVVTMSGAGGLETKGSGPTIDSLDRYRSMKLDGGKLWALHGMSNSLMTIDLATGNRARVSSGESSTKVGPGDAKLGYKMLAVAGPSKVWTSGGWVSGGFALTEVATANGQRTSREGTTGPASFSDDLAGVWVHPTKPLLIVSMDNAFGLYDPATGESVLFSE